MRSTLFFYYCLLIVVMVFSAASILLLTRETQLESFGEEIASVQNQELIQANTRLLALGKLARDVQEDTYLTEKARQSLLAKVQSEQKTLKAIKLTMFDIRDAAGAEKSQRALSKQYINRLFLPSIHLAMTEDTLQTVIGDYTNLEDLIQKLEAQNAQWSPADKTELRTDIVNFQQDMVMAKQISANVQALLPTLATAEYPATSDRLLQVLPTLRQADQSLNQSDQDMAILLRKIKVLLTPPAPPPVASKAINKPTPALPLTSYSRGRILMYHYVRIVNPDADPLGYRLSVTADALEAQLVALSQAGYQPATMADVAAGRTNAHSAVLTFDDGYQDFYTTAYPILKKHGWTATLYIISGKRGGPYLTWDQIRDLQKDGFEIGAHTVNHYELNTLPIDQQRQEIVNSKKEIEAQIGVPVTAFCYPVGRYTADTERLVKEAGFTSATTTNSGLVQSTSDLYALPRVRVSPYSSLGYLTK